MPDKNNEANEGFVLSLETVTSAVMSLRSRRVHRNFAGYLCVKKTCCFEHKNVNVKPNFKHFFEEFLRPSDGTEKKPYISPFVHNADASSDIWTNPNVAGSYAPSSVRTESPFRKVVDIEGVSNNSAYSLRKDHARNTLKHLLFGEKISALDLAIFLYRDMVFLGENITPEDLISLFRSEFGFNKDNTAENNDFNNIFFIPTSEDNVAVHFEKFSSEGLS